MGTWRKWAGFGVWCVVLFGGMILAGGSGGGGRRGAAPVEQAA